MSSHLLSSAGLSILLLQFTGCLAMGLGMTFLLRRNAARAHQILLISLGASLLIPGLYATAHALGLGLWDTDDVVPGREAHSVAVGHVLYAKDSEEGLLASGTNADTGNPRTGAIETEAIGRVLLWLAWAAAALVLMIRLVLQYKRGAQLLRQTESVATAHLQQALHTAQRRLGICGSVELRSSAQIESPAIWCWRRVPALLIQKEAARLKTTCDWQAVFCHELAHWKRLDHIHCLACELLTVALPWHPLVWWARHRLHHLSELACDDWVLAAGQSSTQYAESLLNLTAQKQLVFLPAIVGKEHTMKERIRRIVRGQVGNPSVHRGWTLSIVAVTLCLSVGVALAQRRPADREVHRYQVTDREEVEGSEAARQGRRNVFNRLLDQLRRQLKETELALADDDHTQEHRRVLQAELETLRQQMDFLAQQQQHLGRPDRHLRRTNESRREPSPNRDIRTRGFKDGEVKREYRNDEPQRSHADTDRNHDENAERPGRIIRRYRIDDFDEPRRRLDVQRLRDEDLGRQEEENVRRYHDGDERGRHLEDAVEEIEIRRARVRDQMQRIDEDHEFVHRRKDHPENRNEMNSFREHSELERRYDDADSIDELFDEARDELRLERDVHLDIEIEDVDDQRNPFLETEEGDHASGSEGIFNRLKRRLGGLNRERQRIEEVEIQELRPPFERERRPRSAFEFEQDKIELRDPGHLQHDVETLRDQVSKLDQQMRKVQALLEQLAKDRATDDAVDSY